MKGEPGSCFSSFFFFNITSSLPPGTSRPQVLHQTFIVAATSVFRSACHCAGSVSSLSLLHPLHLISQPHSPMSPDIHSTHFSTNSQHG